VTFTANPANGGTNPTYQWTVNASIVGTNNPSYSYFPAQGDVITCEVFSNANCVSNNPATSPPVSVVVEPLLAVGVSISATATTVCEGVLVTFNAVPINGGTDPFFQWKVNGMNVGLNKNNYSFTPNNGDVVTCTLLSSELCVSTNPVTSNAITLTVHPMLFVSISIGSSANTVCAGTEVQYNAITSNPGAMPVYQWKVNGTNLVSNSPVLLYTPQAGDVVRCVLTSSEVCTVTNPVTSNEIMVTVNPLLPVGNTIEATENPVCSGSSVLYTAIPTNGGNNPFFQWRVNGINVGSNLSTYSYSPLNSDVVSCLLTSSEVCAVGNPVASNAITMTVNALLPVSAVVTASSNPICPGSSVTFSVAAINGGALPAYQWIRNGMIAGSGLATYTCNPAIGDSIRCVVNSSMGCLLQNPVSSNTVIVASLPVPVVSFVACFDTLTTVAAKPIMLKGGIPLGGTYSGSGVNSTTGVFTPSAAGTGIKTIGYQYANQYACSDVKTIRIRVQAAAAFTCGSNFSDVRDGKVYKTVAFGSQCWMAEGLDFGMEIPEALYQRDNCISEKYSHHISATEKYSSYQWDEMMQYSEAEGIKGLCPPAWHIPTEAEWLLLFTNYTNNGFSGSPLKYSGYSGFNAALEGANFSNQPRSFVGFATYIWSSGAHGPFKAWAHAMNDYDPSVSYYPSNRSNAFSVRCVKDY
jgi:uncharacterized protein (TIGR02145 family)